MQEDFRSSRYNQRTKRRKTNIILNGLIGVVLVLIVVVSFVIFSGNDEEVATKSTEATSKSDSDAVKETSSEKSTTSDNTNETTTDKSTSDDDEDKSGDGESTETETMSPEDESAAVITEENSDPNVVKSIVNPNWKPIGTSQSGEHTAVYSGVDWDEMVKAISYATGLAEDNMTIQFLGNNGVNKSKGTVFSKDKSKIYRVSIEWVDQKGWKPTLVEELSSVQ